MQADCIPNTKCCAGIYTLTCVNSFFLIQIFSYRLHESMPGVNAIAVRILYVHALKNIFSFIRWKGFSSFVVSIYKWVSKKQREKKSWRSDGAVAYTRFINVHIIYNLNESFLKWCMERFRLRRCLLLFVCMCVCMLVFHLSESIRYNLCYACFLIP